VFRAVVLAESDTIGLEEFPQIAAQIGQQTGNQIAAAGGPEQSPARDAPPVASVGDFAPALLPSPFDEMPSFSDLPLSDGLPLVAAAGPLAPRDALPLLNAEGEVRSLDEVESELIRYAIAHYRGQMSEVARRLEIGRSTLYRKLEALGLNGERGEGNGEPVAAERQPPKFG
jgi:DNA-binding NtrC family response regulator